MEPMLKPFAHELRSLKKNIAELHSLIQVCEATRQTIGPNDSEAVAVELGKLVDASSKREVCKKQHDNIKHALKDKREHFGDMQLDQIVQNLEARIQQVVRDIEALLKAAEKSPEVKKDILFVSYASYT